MADKESFNVKAAFQLADMESGKFAPQHGGLKEIWGQWPGDEPIEDLLAALKND